MVHGVPAPPGPPVASNPFDWLIGTDSFVSDYSPPLYASGLPGAYLVAIACQYSCWSPPTCGPASLGK